MAVLVKAAAMLTLLCLCSPCRVESGGWTANLSEFRQWLDALPLSGGDSCESALAEGLAEAVFLFRRPSELGKPGDVQNQCLLVTASEPHRLGVLWPFPGDCKEVCMLSGWPCSDLNTYQLGSL